MRALEKNKISYNVFGLGEVAEPEALKIKNKCWITNTAPIFYIMCAGDLKQFL